LDNNLSPRLLSLRRILDWFFLGPVIGKVNFLTPNRITIFRSVLALALLPFWFAFDYSDNFRISALAIWMLCWYLDGVDGAVARHSVKVTELGKRLDPALDKIQFYGTVWIFHQSLNPFLLVTLLVLDMLSTVDRGRKTEFTAANWYGKAKLTFMVFAFLGSGLTGIYQLPAWGWWGNNFLGLSLVFSLLSLWQKMGSRLWANLATSFNFECGLLALYYALAEKRIEPAISLVFAGVILDMFDGLLARKVKDGLPADKFGLYLDDVADLTTFGLAIGAILFQCFEPITGLFLGVFWTAAVFWRLADYTSSVGKVPTGMFRGMPSPAGAILICAVILLTEESHQQFNFLGLTLITVFTIISMVAMTRFKQHWPHLTWLLNGTKKYLFMVIAGFALVSCLSGLVSWQTALFGLGLIYLLSPFWLNLLLLAKAKNEVTET
jgi:CDP-diacylglycerol---serine O-phosphatidyltransferase